MEFPFMKTVKPERLKSSKPEWLKVISRYESSVAVYPGGIVKRTKLSDQPTPLMLRMLYPSSANVRVSRGTTESDGVLLANGETSATNARSWFPIVCRF